MRSISIPEPGGGRKTAGPTRSGFLEGSRHQLARRCLNNSVLELNEAALLSGTRTKTPSFALSAVGKEFRRLAGANDSLRGQQRNRAQMLFCEERQ
jgi:hypothetical protein